MTTKAFEALARFKRFPAPGAVAVELLELSRYGKCTPAELESAAAHDAELARSLLALANATCSSSDAELDSLARAAELLGIPIVRIATLAFSLLAAHRSGPCSTFDYEDFWSRSLARAVAAEVMSGVTGVGTPAEAFALGLLSEIGLLALANAQPEKYAELHAGAASPGARELAEAERRAFGIDHGEVGARLLESFGVPTAFANALRRYESLGSPTSGGRVRCIDELLLVASSIAAYCTSGDLTAGLEDRPQALDLDGLARRTGLTPQRFHESCSRIVLDWHEWEERWSIRQTAAELAEPAAEAPEAPAAADAAAPAAAERPPRPRPPRRGRDRRTGLRILVVDDDPTLLGLLERHLFLAGHSVTIARAGDEALRVALETSPQLVVADWQMPGLDGLELCKELRTTALGRKVYYLLLTGHGEVENVVRAFDAGVDDYVEKPFNPDILLARIKAGRRIIDLQEQVERDQATQQQQVAELQLLTRRLQLAAMTDVLTGLPNRRFAMKRLAQAWESSHATGASLSIVMIDIDEFKRVNDDHGHDAGDAVLRDTGRLLRSVLREKEDVCRLGGEEFLVICANSELEKTACLAERLRAEVERSVVRWGDFEGAVTLSLGVAQRESWMHSSDDLLKAADAAVYRAKDAGRNQVRIAEGRPKARIRSA